MTDIGNKFYWIYDELYEWLPAKLKECSDSDYYEFYCLINGNTKTKKIIKSEIILKEVHPSCLNGVDDLLMLGDFDKQTMLQNTRARFYKDNIYSFIGFPIIIAVNPYKKLNIYTENIMNEYKNYHKLIKLNPDTDKKPVPHLYYIAEAAYQDMILEKKNQSIIISGESGSGKTESTKIIMKFLAANSLIALNNNTSIIDNNKINKPSVEKQVLDSNPLLEAFGNAKTVRNNNSSRFGKFIQINFTDTGRIISARIFNYLLEKSRIVSIGSQERNYHIFYQLIKGANELEQKKHYIKDLDYYDLLSCGTYENDDQNDYEDFLVTKECMKKLGFKQEELNLIFNVVMGILYLGNLKFEESEDDSSLVKLCSDNIEKQKEDLRICAELIGVSEENMLEILTTKKLIDPMSKKTIKKLNKIEMVYNCRNALCKALYAKMFDYIVKRINAAISNTEEINNLNLKDNKEKEKIKKIGILDIFGFENFETNSFEQLCINYANERLQQFFNNHIFKLEQEEYKKEGIDYTQVEFKDNKTIIELIDDPKNSIFALLDSEGLLPNSDNYNFRNKIYKNCKNNHNLGENIEGYISINHFAGECYYDVESFIEKNMDQLTLDISTAMENSKNKLVKKIFEIKESSVINLNNKKKKAASNTGKLMADSLSKQFKLQLDDLIKMLIQSNPRFVKCIKPNSEKKPLDFDSHDVCSQLLSAGVLEAVKIRNQGYSVRRTIEEFVKRYMFLTPQIFNFGSKNFKEASCLENNSETNKSNKILKAINNDNNYSIAIEEMFNLFKKENELCNMFSNKKYIQIGYNKVFMKEEVKIILEYKLNKIKFTNKILALYRGYLKRKEIKLYKKSVNLINAHIKGINARKKFKFYKSSVIIKRNYLHYIFKKNVFKALYKLSNEYIKIKEEEKAQLKKKLELDNIKLKKDQNNLKRICNESNKNINNNNNTGCYKIINDNEISELNNIINKQDKSARTATKSNTNTSNPNSFKLSDNYSSSISKIKSSAKKKKKNIFDSLTLDNNFENIYNELLLKFTTLNEDHSKIKDYCKILEKSIEEKTKEIDTLKLQLSKANFIYNKSVSNENLIAIDNKIVEFDKNIELLNSNIPNDTSFNEKLEKTTSYFDRENELLSQCHLEIKKLKKDLCLKESNYEMLSLKSSAYIDKVKELELSNENLKSQLKERKDNVELEFKEFYTQINNLENEKADLERKLRSTNANNKNNEQSINNFQINKSPNIRKTNNTSSNMSENKQLLTLNAKYKKQIEELKINNQLEVEDYKSQIKIKDKIIKQIEDEINGKNIELSFEKNKNKSMKEEFEICNNQLIKLKDKFQEVFNNNSKIEEYSNQLNRFKLEMQEKLNKKDHKINILIEEKEELELILDQKEKKEEVFKDTLLQKDKDIEIYRQNLNDLEKETNKLDIEVMRLKKEYQLLLINKQKIQKEFKYFVEEQYNVEHKENELFKEKVELLSNKNQYLNNKILLLKTVYKKSKQSNTLMVSLLKAKNEELLNESLLTAVKNSSNNDSKNKDTFNNCINEKERIKNLQTILLKSLQEINKNNNEEDELSDSSNEEENNLTSSYQESFEKGLPFEEDEDNDENIQEFSNKPKIYSYNLNNDMSYAQDDNVEFKLVNNKSSKYFEK